MSGQSYARPSAYTGGAWNPNRATFSGYRPRTQGYQQPTYNQASSSATPYIPSSNATPPGSAGSGTPPPVPTTQTGQGSPQSGQGATQPSLPWGFGPAMPSNQNTVVNPTSGPGNFANDPTGAFMSQSDRARAELLKWLPQGDMSQYGMGMQGSGIEGTLANKLFGANYKAVTGQDFAGNTPYTERAGYMDKYAPWVNANEYGSNAGYNPVTGLMTIDGKQSYFDPRNLGYTPQWLQASAKPYGDVGNWFNNLRQQTGIKDIGSWYGS